MGEVYAAYDPELDRKVAIKLLRGKAGDDAEAAAGRLRMMREAQAIAKLSHPNVVVVYDVGAYQDKVFVAMEFVDGNTLWYWMHAQPRAWPEVLKIFADAGRGLAAAHDKDLVHRDFKPENVMLSGDGQVRVMDFGLARSVGRRDAAAGAGPSPDLAPHLPTASRPPVTAVPPAAEVDPMDVESTRQISSPRSGSNPTMRSPAEALSLNLTQTGAILGTPAYMSPEQFRGDDTDARTDQFSFCVALYEALYGERPFAGNTPQAVESNVLRGAVREPPAKSDVPGWIRKVLLRGLSASVGERWPSMNDLLAELDRKRLFVGRQRFAESAAASLSDIWPAPVDGAPVETTGRAEMRATFLATGKTYAAATFENVSRTLDRYAQSWTDMYIDICEATHVRGDQSTDVMDLRMASLMDLRERFRVLCRVFRQADGDVVENAVGAAAALGSVDRCRDLAFLRSAVKPPESEETRAAVDGLRARLAEVRVSAQVGRLNDGRQVLTGIEEEVRGLGYLPLVAEMLLESGKLFADKRDGAAAARVLEDAVWAAEVCRHDEVSAEATAILVFVVGDTQGRFDVAEVWARFAETLLRRMGGHDALWGWLFNNRGAMRSRQGRLAEALDDGRAAVAAKERAGGQDSPDVAQSLNCITNWLVQLDRADEALPYIERTVRIVESTLGPDHPRGAFMLNNYAEVLNALARYAAAEAVARRAVAMFDREFGADDLLVTYPMTALGISLIGAGKIAEALSILERATAVCEAKETDPAHLAEVHFALARALAAAGRDPSRARALAARAADEYSRAVRVPLTEREVRRIGRFLAETNR